jgi:uncharacterized protein (TIGR03437 family)
MSWAVVLCCAAGPIATHAQTVSTVASFGTSTDPPASLMQGTDGNFYGTTAGFEPGTIFKMTPTGTLTTLYTFPLPGGNVRTNYSTAAYGLVQGRDGNFYGTTQIGGIGTCFINNVNLGCGTVFSVTPGGSETTLYQFDGKADGGEPNPNLIQATDGNFYGTTQFGGVGCQPVVLGCGTIFRIAPGVPLTTIYRFGATTTGPGPAPDGATPFGGLIQASDGNLYGTTQFGGTGGTAGMGGCGYNPETLVTAAGCGTIFKTTTGGSLTTLDVLAGRPGAAVPAASLIQGTDGNFYGTTVEGGASFPGMGTFFKITSSGALTVLYNFDASANGAYNPIGNFVQAGDGNFYGVAAGGANGLGALYKITPAGVETVVHSFGASSTDSANPNGLILGSDGNIYGTASGTAASAAANPQGTVFRVTLPGSDSPAVTAVVNGASFVGGGIVPGEMATLFGTNLTSASGINLTSGLPLPSAFAKASVNINGAPAPLFAVDNLNGQQQINFEVPWGVASGPNAMITVMNSGATSPVVSVPVLAAQPGIFSYSVGGNSFGAILHANFQLADTAHPAKPGDTVLIYCTGLGAVTSAPADGAVGNGQPTIAMPTVTMGGMNAIVSFSGLAPGFVGLYQINAEVPAALKAGNQAVLVDVAAVSSNSVLLPVQ